MRIQNIFSLNMVSKLKKSLGILGLGFRRVVNSGDPSNDCASLQSYYSREPQPLSEQPIAGKIFQRDFQATLTSARGHSTRIARA